MDSRIVRLVRDDRAPGVGGGHPGAGAVRRANLRHRPAGVITESRESLFWVAMQAIRDRQRRGDAAGAGPDPGAAAGGRCQDFAAGPACRGWRSWLAILCPPSARWAAR